MNCFLFYFHPYFIGLPFVLSSRTNRSLRPIHFLCLSLIVSIRALSAPIIVGTSSFVICSVQLIFSTLPHIHISKASGLFISSFYTVHVLSDPHRRTLHSSVFTIRYSIYIIYWSSLGMLIFLSLSFF